MLSVTPEEFCRKWEAVVQVVLQGQADSGNSPNSAAPTPGPRTPPSRSSPPQTSACTPHPNRPGSSQRQLLQPGPPRLQPSGLGGRPRPAGLGIRTWKALGPIPTPLSVLGSPPRQLGAPLPELLAVLGGHRSGPGGRPGRWVTGALRDSPPGPRNLRASPGRFPATGHPLLAPGGAILDMGTPPPPSAVAIGGLRRPVDGWTNEDLGSCGPLKPRSYVRGWANRWAGEAGLRWAGRRG